MTEYLIITLQKKVNKLIPHIRHKRALLNTIGNINIWAFENFDSDKERYNNKISSDQWNKSLNFIAPAPILANRCQQTYTLIIP